MPLVLQNYTGIPRASTKTPVLKAGSMQLSALVWEGV